MALVGILQSTLASRLHILGVTPNMVLLVTISWTLLRGTQEGSVVALAGGVVFDALSSAPFGAATLSLVAVALVAGVWEMNLFRSIRLVPYMAALLGTLVHGMVFLFVMRVAGRPVIWGAMFWEVIAPALLVNTVAMIPVHIALRWAQAQLRPPPVEWE